mmetsp:Transcript_18707/g.28012  ORF Transcript_18707/g.28012 Transcript_18707/m.28012 type:complete len:591 (-) Transcript_18707:71-1843(-)
MGAGKSALHQKYKIKEVIGRGHFSIVKRCVDKKTGENLALKCINKNKLKEKDHRWLESEIEILQAVKHTNICRLVEVFQTQKMCYLVLELLQGGDLLERVADDHSFTDSDAADVIRTVAGVLDYLHGMGIIHRDLKPQNLVYRSSAKGAQLVVTDFGLSKFLKDGATHTKTACGTPLYLAPEVIMGNGYGKECDLWSLGVMLYVLLTGYYPFYSSDRKRLYSKITRCSYKWPDGGNDVDDRAKDLVAKLLVVDHKKRYTAREVLQHPWLGLPRAKSANKGRAKAIAKMRARDMLRKSVNHLIDIIRFVSVFSLLPEEVQKRCSGRTYRKPHAGLQDKFGAALSQMAVALVDKEKFYNLVYQMKSGGYWLAATDTKKEVLIEHAKKYFTAEDDYFIFSGPKRSKCRFLSQLEFDKLADYNSALQNTSPVKLPEPDVEDEADEDGKRPSIYIADHENKNKMARKLTENEANALVKVTAKLIASKLFSPKKRKVRFDFRMVDDENEKKTKEASNPVNKEVKSAMKTLLITPRTLEALRQQVLKAESRLEVAKHAVNAVKKKDRKRAQRELKVAGEALEIARRLHKEACQAFSK